MRVPKGAAVSFIPREVLLLFPENDLLRDVLAAVTVMYCMSRPRNRIVHASLAEIAKASGRLPTQKNLLLVEDALAFLRAFPAPRLECSVRQGVWGTLEAWGFISFATIERLRNGREVKLGRRRVSVCLSEPYARLLDGFLEGER